jgi:hypothetical protein
VSISCACRSWKWHGNSFSVLPYVLFGTCISRDDPRNDFTDFIRTLPAKYSKPRHLRGKCRQLYGESGLLCPRTVCTTMATDLVSNRKRKELPFRLQNQAFSVLLHCRRMFIYALLTIAINKIPLFSSMLRVCFQLLCSIVRNKLSFLDE